jgi:alpha-beta hydrolase superfamily lysophospholipase
LFQSFLCHDNRYIYIFVSRRTKPNRRVWKPGSKPKAVVTLVHGLGEHCGRYTPYIENFVNEGIAFVGFDLMGHGLSEGDRGTITEYQNLIDDVDICVLKTKALFPGVPQFVYAHSMGGNIVVNYLIRFHPKISGAVITSPWLKLTKEPLFLAKWISRILEWIIPDVTISNGLNIAHISHLAEEVEKYKTDKLNHDRISFLLFNSIAQNGVWAIKNSHLLKTPVLLTHGLDDKITSPKASHKFAKENPNYVEWKEWPAMYHELHNEAIRQELAKVVIQWMKKIVPFETPNQ